MFISVLTVCEIIMNGHFSAQSKLVLAPDPLSPYLDNGGAKIGYQ